MSAPKTLPAEENNDVKLVTLRTGVEWLDKAGETSFQPKDLTFILVGITEVGPVHLVSKKNRLVKTKNATSTDLFSYAGKYRTGQKIRGSNQQKPPHGEFIDINMQAAQELGITTILGLLLISPHQTFANLGYAQTILVNARKPATEPIRSPLVPTDHGNERLFISFQIDRHLNSNRWQPKEVREFAHLPTQTEMRAFGIHTSSDNDAFLDQQIRYVVRKHLTATSTT